MLLEQPALALEAPKALSAQKGLAGPLRLVEQSRSARPLGPAEPAGPLPFAKQRGPLRLAAGAWESPVADGGLPGWAEQCSLCKTEPFV